MSEYVTGASELDAQLARLANRVLSSAVRRGTNAGLTLIAKAIRTRAPRGATKQLSKSIGKRLVRGQAAGTILGKAGVDVGKRKASGKKRSAPHGHLVTLGTVDRYTKRGLFRGRSPGNDFVSQGFAASSGQAAIVLLDRVVESLVQAGAS